MIAGTIYIIIAMTVGFGVGFAVAQIGRSRPAMPADLQVVLDQKIQELAEHKQEVANHFVETSTLVRNMTDSYRVVLEHLNRGAEKLVGEFASGNPLELAGHASLLESQHKPQSQQLPETAAKSSVALENTEEADAIINSPKEASDLSDGLAAKQTADEQTSYRDTEPPLASSILKDNSVEETLAPPVTEARNVVENVQRYADAKQKGEVPPMQTVTSNEAVKQLDAEKVNAEQIEVFVESTSKAQSEREESQSDEALSVEGCDLAAAKMTVDLQHEQPSEVKEEATKVWRREDEVEETEESSLVNASMANHKSSGRVAPS